MSTRTPPVLSSQTHYHSLDSQDPILSKGKNNSFEVMKKAADLFKRTQAAKQWYEGIEKSYEDYSSAPDGWIFANTTPVTLVTNLEHLEAQKADFERENSELIRQFSCPKNIDCDEKTLESFSNTIKQIGVNLTFYCKLPSLKNRCIQESQQFQGKKPTSYTFDRTDSNCCVFL